MQHLENIRNYWNLRAEGYSLSNQEELKDINHLRWVNTINKYSPEGDTLKVLDIGCGPGFFAIMMAACGHKVTAIDYSEGMLEQANKNAFANGQVINFIKMDAQNLSFDDDTFDLIVTRNVSWCLENPEKAYREWFRVLKKGGRIVNFDANHYLGRFDKDFNDAVQHLRERSKAEHGRFIGDVDTEIINNIALDLPLSKEKRPNWDYNILTSIGAHIINVELFDHIQVEKADGTKEFYANSFVISGRK